MSATIKAGRDEERSLLSKLAAVRMVLSAYGQPARDMPETPNPWILWTERRETAAREAPSSRADKFGGERSPVDMELFEGDDPSKENEPSSGNAVGSDADEKEAGTFPSSFGSNPSHETGSTS